MNSPFVTTSFFYSLIHPLLPTNLSSFSHRGRQKCHRSTWSLLLRFSILWTKSLFCCHVLSSLSLSLLFLSIKMQYPSSSRKFPCSTRCTWWLSPWGFCWWAGFSVGAKVGWNESSNQELEEWHWSRICPGKEIIHKPNTFSSTSA